MREAPGLHDGNGAACQFRQHRFGFSSFIFRRQGVNQYA
jgi:hypothetical protein